LHVDIKMLRRGFKAVCKATDNRFQNYQIRVHRSLSWLERALELDPETQPDGRLLYAWIAFSSLCGRWDLEAGYPVRDKECREAFLEMLMGIDRAGMLGEKIVALESDILWLLENKFLDPRFWKDPDKPGNVRAKYHLALRLYHDKNWGGIMQHTLDRIAVLRGQIVHGAATRGSSLNRESLNRCRTILEALLPVILQLVIEHRADDDWPPLCYPPIRE
jgi:hypothetical protein